MVSKALLWLIFTYAVFKLAAMARARPPGFRHGASALQHRLRAGEPIVLLAALAVALPAALLTSRYALRTVTDLHERSVACYGRIMALRGVPAFADRVDGYVVYERVEGHRSMAFKTATELGIAPAKVRETLAARIRAFTTPRGRTTPAAIAEAERCLLPPGAV